MLGLVLKWVDAQGGVEGLEKIKKAKAKILYDVLDEPYTVCFSTLTPVSGK